MAFEDRLDFKSNQFDNLLDIHIMLKMLPIYILSTEVMFESLPSKKVLEARNNPDYLLSRFCLINWRQCKPDELEVS